jgi:hypothetical protein
MDFKTRSTMTSACQGCISGARLGCSDYSEQALLHHVHARSLSPGSLAQVWRWSIAKFSDATPTHRIHPIPTLFCFHYRCNHLAHNRGYHVITSALPPTHASHVHHPPASPRRIAVLVSSTEAMADDATASAHAQDVALGEEGVTDINALDQGTLLGCAPTPPLHHHYIVATQHGCKLSRLHRL